MKIANIAQIAHEANRAYCATLGDFSQAPWDDAPSWQRRSAIDGVVAIVEGRVTSPSDSHANWLADKDAEGWSYGPVKDPATKTHPCFVLFQDLPPDQQLKDTLFFGVVSACLGRLLYDAMTPAPAETDPEPDFDPA